MSHCLVSIKARISSDIFVFHAVRLSGLQSSPWSLSFTISLLFQISCVRPLPYSLLWILAYPLFALLGSLSSHQSFHYRALLQRPPFSCFSLYHFQSLVHGHYFTFIYFLPFCCVLQLEHGKKEETKVESRMGWSLCPCCIWCLFCRGILPRCCRFQKLCVHLFSPHPHPFHIALHTSPILFDFTSLSLVYSFSPNHFFSSHPTFLLYIFVSVAFHIWELLLFPVNQ